MHPAGDPNVWLTLLCIIGVRTTALQKCEEVPSRARIHGSQTCVSLNSRLESNKEDEEEFLSNPDLRIPNLDPELLFETRIAMFGTRFASKQVLL